MYTTPHNFPKLCQHTPTVYQILVLENGLFKIELAKLDSCAVLTLIDIFLRTAIALDLEAHFRAGAECMRLPQSSSATWWLSALAQFRSKPDFSGVAKSV